MTNVTKEDFDKALDWENQNESEQNKILTAILTGEITQKKIYIQKDGSHIEFDDICYNHFDLLRFLEKLEECVRMRRYFKNNKSSEWCEKIFHFLNRKTKTLTFPVLEEFYNNCQLSKSACPVFDIINKTCSDLNITNDDLNVFAKDGSKLAKDLLSLRERNTILEKNTI